MSRGRYDTWRSQWEFETDSRSPQGYFHREPKFDPLRWQDYDRYDFPRSGSTGGARMANALPWLLSMSLLGFGEFAAQPGTDSLSRELEAPSAAHVSFPSSSGFHQPIDNYDDSGRSIEDHSAHVGCDSNENLVGRTPSSYEDTSAYFSGRGVDFAGGNNALIGFDLHGFRYGSSRYNDEVGPAMELVYAWSTIDFQFDDIESRDNAIFDGEFIAENNLPLGLDVWRDKVFVTLPKWKEGIPATLATVPRRTRSKSPKLKPYPDWSWNRADNCEGLMSVFRLQVDECDRLWVLDSGKTNVGTKAKTTCPPTLLIFDLQTDALIRKYVLPIDQVKEDSLFTNIVIDIRNNDCGGAVAYMSDVWRFGIVVYDLYKDSSFRVDHHLFFPDPLASKYELHGMKFRWTDGIFGMALSPIDINDDRILFFHPMSSFREFAVSTRALRDKRTSEDSLDMFTPIGRPRAKDYGHSSSSVIDKYGVMFFNMVTRDSVWCWDTRKEYIPQNLGVIGTSNVSLIFPNDIKVDHEEDQSVWLLSNRLPMYLYGRFDPGSVNFRVFRADVKDAVRDTVCDPNYLVPDSDQGYDEVC